MKKMIVIFEDLEPVHLGKDVGLLPLSLNINENWDISIFSTFKQFSQKDYEKNIKLRFFVRFKYKILNKLVLFLNILRDAKNIDYLMVFHGGKDKSILFALCKVFNKKLITYVKLDMGELNAKAIINKIEKESFFKKKIRSILGKSVDIFTVETEQVFEMIKDFPLYKNKIHYLPNGFYSIFPYDWNVKKEKIIVTVGRIGLPQKNNELLLYAIEQLDDIKEYSFYIVQVELMVFGCL